MASNYTSKAKETKRGEGLISWFLGVSAIALVLFWVFASPLFSQSEHKPWITSKSQMKSTPPAQEKKELPISQNKTLSKPPESTPAEAASESVTDKNKASASISAPSSNSSLTSIPESTPPPIPTEIPGNEDEMPVFAPIELKRLSLGDSISQALQKNLDIKIKSVDKSIGEDLRRQAVGAFNPAFKFDGTHDDIKRPQNTQDFQATGGTAANLLSREPRIFEERNYHGKASLEGKLPTGTKYEVYTKLDILKNTLNTTSPLSLYNPEEWQTFTGIDVTQPLLKGFGTDVNLADLRVARTNLQISEQEFRSQMLETVATALQTYYDLIYLAQDYRFKQEEYQLSARLTEEKKRLFEKGKVSPRDVNRAETALAQSIEEVTQAQNKLIEKQTQLLVLIGEVDPLESPFLIEPTSGMPDEAPFLDTASLIREAFLKRPEYISAKYKVERENIKLIYARNQIWPQLDFKTTAGYNGLSYGYSKSMKNAFSGSAAQWSLGFVFSVPIGNDTAIGAKNEAIHRKENALMTLQQVENNTTLGIQQFVAIVKSNMKRYDAMTIFRRNAERAVEEEELRLEKGLSSELDLLKFKRDRTDARTREFAARADVNKVLVRLYQLNGTLLDRQKILVVD